MAGVQLNHSHALIFFVVLVPVALILTIVGIIVHSGGTDIDISEPLRKRLFGRVFEGGRQAITKGVGVMTVTGACRVTPGDAIPYRENRVDVDLARTRRQGSGGCNEEEGGATQACMWVGRVRVR